MPQGNQTRLPESETFWQIKIDKKLHYKFELECLKRQTTMNNQIEQLIREFLKGGK